MKKLYALVTGLALGLGVLMGSAAAGEKFTLLENIPAQALSQSEMAQVEGKYWVSTTIGVLWLNPINNYLWRVYPNGASQYAGYCGYYGCFSSYGYRIR